MKTLFYHGFTTDNRRFTVAGKIITAPEDSKVVTLGIAICGEHERFIKKVGRVKAESRLNGSKLRGIKSVYLTPTKVEGIESIEKTDAYIFYNEVSSYKDMDSRQLKKEFNLYH